MAMRMTSLYRIMSEGTSQAGSFLVTHDIVAGSEAEAEALVRKQAELDGWTYVAVEEMERVGPGTGGAAGIVAAMGRTYFPPD